MRNRAARMLEEAARRAQRRTYPKRAVDVARRWKYPDGAQRLVPAPVFILSSIRSGSDIVRRMLDGHSRICAPDDLHLSSWRVDTNNKNAQAALDASGLTRLELANLLWDRVLHLQLIDARKSVIVDRSPRNSLLWKRIAAVWPQARFLVLVRHPVRVAELIAAAHPGVDPETLYADIEKYAIALHEAQHGTSNVLTVRYEDLVTNPEGTTKRITAWLDVPWESGMVDEQLEPDSRPTEVPPGLQKSCELLGYL